MTPTMTSQTATAPEARKKELTWVVEMPKEIADAFGVPEQLPVTLHAQPGKISAQMDLTGQTDEARGREPGWFVEMPVEAAAVSGFAEGSFIGIYAKSGSLYVEMVSLPPPEIIAEIDQLCEKNRALFEELKQLGD